MGVYLGSNDLLGGGGGGQGALLSDPTLMNRTYVYTPRCEAKTAESSHVFIYTPGMHASFFHVDRGGSGNLALSTVDTYLTTHDITNAAGGILHVLQFPALYAGAVGDTSTCRITLDGEEYVISTSLKQIDNFGYYKPLMGNYVLGGMTRIGNNAGTGVDTNNFGNHYRGKHSSAGNRFTNGFDGGSDNASMYTYVPTVASKGQLGGVRFKESLKVEFKADKVTAGSYGANKVGSLVTTF